MESNKDLGQKIAEGKTKIIYQVANNTQHVVMVSKNSISAGNGLKRDELPGKARCSNLTACNVFRLLQLSSIPTHFIRQESAESFRALKCSMIPLEVIVRRLAAGSYLKRHPELKQGHKFETPIVEFTFKDDTLGDPLITDEEILQKALVCGPVTVDTKIIEQLKSLALKTFLVLEKAWSLLEVTLVDFKVEFGVTSDGQVILADVIDNDSWRIWPKGDPSQMKDKQVYRNLPIGKLQESDVTAIMNNYEWVASETTRLIDSIIEPMGSGPLVGMIMGSQSDWETMKNASTILDQLNIPYEARIVSAHRTPERLFAYAKTAKSRGLKVIIAGAGGAAHLPGMVSSLTVLPVLGVPVQSRTLSGMDSLLSIVQMPGGVPVGTLAIGNAGATNAALLAASILASSGKYPDIEMALELYREKQTASIAEIPVDSTESTKLHITQSHTPTIVSTPHQIIQTVSQNMNQAPPTFPLKMIQPGATIGIVGGGQLAKMIAVAAAQLGYKSHIYCPEKDSPAFYVSNDFTMADYTDQKSLSLFAAKVSVVTYEFENVPKETVDALSRWVPVRPNGEVLAICQNRLKEKRFINSVGVQTTKFESVESVDELKRAIEIIGYPAIIKSNTMGYDGKGQIFIKQEDDLSAVWQKMQAMKSPVAILEAFVDFAMEISVIVCRGFDGQTSTFPVVENRHQNHILKQTIVPADVSDSVKTQAIESAIKIANGINLIGILAVEMFVTKDNKILVNELAPRPHNSGHWSIEGCATSQFEQHVRTICGLPLGSTKLLSKRVVMNNLLGDEIHEWMKYLQMENARLHVYGKAEARPGRKMGHVTFLYDD